jgi:hypothetical protein
MNMKKRIQGKLCDTDSATLLGTKYAGEFGHSDGYEERLYLTRTKQHFMYGVGGAESKYPKETINLIMDAEAEEWKKENIAKIESAPKKTPANKKKTPAVKKDAATKKKQLKKRTAKTVSR